MRPGKKAFGILLLAAALGVSAAAVADSRHASRQEMHIDNRYNHNRSYPVHGYVYAGLPRGYATVGYRGGPYYYGAGVWYRPYGPRFVVVAPPIGIGIGVLPPYYTTVWFGGVPYYYADQTYYQWYPARREYVVTQPPAPQRQPEHVGDA